MLMTNISAMTGKALYKITLAVITRSAIFQVKLTMEKESKKLVPSSLGSKEVHSQRECQGMSFSYI